MTFIRVFGLAGCHFTNQSPTPRRNLATPATATGLPRPSVVAQGSRTRRRVLQSSRPTRNRPRPDLRSETALPGLVGCPCSIKPTRPTEVLMSALDRKQTFAVVLNCAGFPRLIQHEQLRLKGANTQLSRRSGGAFRLPTHGKHYWNQGLRAWFTRRTKMESFHENSCAYSSSGAVYRCSL